MSSCPCCSGKSYAACCQPFIEQAALPDTPEQLMRSRYTAFTQANMDYIANTMQGPAVQAFNADDGKRWAESVEWKKLEVVESGQTGDEGFVKFRAYFIDANGLQCMDEHSIFQRIDAQWYYIDSLN